MKFLIATWYEFLKNLRDFKMLIFVVAFPILTTYLLGSAVQGFFKPDAGQTIEAAYVNLDKGAVGKAFDAFIRSDEIKGKLDTTAYGSLDEGQKAVSSGQSTVLISLPENLSGSVMGGSTGTIELSGGTGLEFVDTLAGSFASSFNASLAVAQTGGNPAQAERAEVVTSVSHTRGGKFPNLTDYYAVLELLEALIIGAIFGVYITARNYGSDIHIRIHALPVNSWTLLFGRIAGSVVYLLMASAATILFTRYVYGVDWGADLPVLAGTLAVFCFIAVGMGVLCGRVFKKVSTSIMVVLALMIFFGTVAGSVSPRSGVTALGFLSPNYYAKLLVFGSIYGYSAEVMVPAALWLIGIAAAVGIAIAASTRRVRYDNL